MAIVRAAPTPEAATLWNKRAKALAAGSVLLEKKPDRKKWTRRDRRIYVYALAISQRIEKLQ